MSSSSNNQNNQNGSMMNNNNNSEDSSASASNKNKNNNNNNNAFPNPRTNRVGQWFGNVEAVLSDPEGALDGALEAIRMTEDLTDDERKDLENIADFCKARLEVQQD